MILSRDQIIADHLPIAWAIKDPDARSAALAKLVEIADVLVKLGKEPENLSGMLKVAMRNAATDAVRDEIRHKLRVRRALHSGGSKMRVVSDTAVTSRVVSRGSPVVDQLAAKEELAACCFTDFDREVMKLKMLDYTNVEIAKMLGVSKQAVGYCVQAVTACLARRGV